MKLGDKVHCKSYLVKESDGVMILLKYPNGEFYLYKNVDSSDIKAYACDHNGEFKELGEWCGDGVEKTYRKKIECEFDGIYVGTVTVKVKGYIGTDWDDGDDYHRAYGYCFKKTTEADKCGVIYYQPNKKRYVPIEDIEVKNDREID